MARQLYRISIPGLTSEDQFVYASSVAQAMLLLTRRLLHTKGTINYDQQQYRWPKFQPLYTKVVDNNMFSAVPEVPKRMAAPATPQQMMLPFEERIGNILDSI